MNIPWEEIKNKLKAELPKNTYSLWIEPLTFQQTDPATIVIGCPNKFARTWVAENYTDMIADEFKALGLGRFDLLFDVQPQAPRKEEPHTEAPKQLLLPNFPGNGAGAFLQRDFTFDQFVVGRSNEFAYSVARAFALESQSSCRTLCMMAETGLGKTHLSHAAAHLIFTDRPDTRLYYITAEQFANEMVFSLKNNRIEQFKEKYRRACDVLLLEEVHFLSGKEKIQGELAYTLDALFNDNKKILFTSSLPPNEIPNISRELSSRLTSGLVASIDKPDKETRIKILTRKAERLQLSLPEDVMDLLASRIEGDVRRLESALKCLKARSELLGEKVDAELAKEVLRCIVPETRRPGVDDIKDLVCRYFKLNGDELRSRSRKRIHAVPRNIYLYLCRRHTEESVETIAKTVDRSVSAVIYAVETVAHRMKADQGLKKQIQFFTEKLKAPQGD